jgi:hypothetical protein
LKTYITVILALTLEAILNPQCKGNVPADDTTDYRKIRDLVVGYHKKYGDDITFLPGAYFANAYNTREQVNKDLHDGLSMISRIVGKGFRPKSVVAGFLSASNQQYGRNKPEADKTPG